MSGAFGELTALMVSGVFAALLTPGVYGAGTDSCLGRSVSHALDAMLPKRLTEGVHREQQQTGLNQSVQDAVRRAGRGAWRCAQDRA